MDIKNMKISEKLAISASVFLLPLGIMLYSLISASFISIQKNQRELNGIEVLLPAVSLMQIIPQYIRLYVDDAPGDLDFTRQYAEELLIDLKIKHNRHFGSSYSVISMNSLSENWDHLTNTKIRDTVLWAYRQLMGDLYRLVVFIGDISGLITDSELESAYLIAAAVHELPQAQDRMLLIGNLLRTAEQGAFTQRRKEELFLNLELLVYSDNVRIQNRFSSLESLRLRDSETLESFELLLKTCHDRIAYFARTVEDILHDDYIDLDRFSVLYEAANNANNAAYRLQAATFDRLNHLISARIKTYTRQFITSLFLSISAAILAFFIIIFTILNIRKSTLTLTKVFKRLDGNDLSVKIRAFSNDELGLLMAALGNFLDKLNADFSSFNRNANMVATSVLELSSSARQVTVTANEQSASVSEIVSTMENNKNLSIQTAEKTIEVAQLADETQQLSRRGADLRDANEEMMLNIRNQNSKIIDIIKNLADMLSRIDESIQLIDTIADRTKLISFNAALEASSSGEAGKRFAVVAGEIRRFADSVVESAAEIKEKISELQEASQMLITEANSGTKAIDTGYNRMVEQKKVFENIVDVSHNVASRSLQISNLSKQQEMASAQVFSALKEISSGINQFVEATMLTSATMDKLNIMSVELQETLNKYHTVNRGNI
jgi:methyl-accepting chemotaxis protein